MERKPPPPPMASWPLPPLTSPHYGMVKGRSAKNGASKYPRSNKEGFIPFPTSGVGHYKCHGSFGVGPYSYGCHPGQAYQCVRPMVLPQYQVQPNLFGIVRCGTGVFHSPQLQTEYNKARVGANYNHFKGRWTKEGGGEDNYQNRRNKNDSKGKMKNGESEKVKKEECHDNSLPPGIVLPMEWTY